MSNPTIYTFNGKMARVRNGVLGSVPAEPVDYVTIGTQTWKIQDLAIDDGQGGVTINDGVYIYTLAAAQRIAAANFPGWHVPTADEWYDLLKNYMTDPLDWSSAAEAQRLAAINALCTGAWTYMDNQSGTTYTYEPENISGLGITPGAKSLRIYSDYAESYVYQDGPGAFYQSSLDSTHTGCGRIAQFQVQGTWGGGSTKNCYVTPIDSIALYSPTYHEAEYAAAGSHPTYARVRLIRDV